jgi:hypothetical protein
MKTLSTIVVRHSMIRLPRGIFTTRQRLMICACFLTSDSEPSASIPTSSSLTSTRKLLSSVTVGTWGDDEAYMREPLSKNCIVLFEVPLLMQRIVMACLRSLALAHLVDIGLPEPTSLVWRAGEKCDRLYGYRKKTYSSL